MINLGLARISRLLGLLAKQKGTTEYQPPWKAIHIAGTNGKGSVAAYISALLNLTSRPTISGHQKGKINVGRFTSPHFIDSWDCIKINDETVSYQSYDRARSKIVSLAAQVEHELLQEMSSNPTGREQVQQDARLTEFELLTATAFELFTDSKHGSCDISVIECGLGGRHDATNALPTSAIQLSVITRIGLDHLDMLGGSLQGIVHEKCGILRGNVPVVIDGDNDPEILGLIQHEIMHRMGEEQLKSSVHVARAEDLDQLINRTVSTVGGLSSSIGNGKANQHLLNLMPHQKSNLAIALKVCELFGVRYNDANTTVDSATISTNLLNDVLKRAAKSYPGRLQWLQPGELIANSSGTHLLPNLSVAKILLDGAHNTQSALALRSCVDKELQKSVVIPEPLPESFEGVDDDFTEPPISTTTTTTPHPHATSKIKTDVLGSSVQQSSDIQPPRKVIWILAMSSGKNIFEILETLIQSSKDEIIFTTFGPVQDMPWVKPTSLASLISSSEVLDLQYHVKATIANIVEALDVAEDLVAKYTDQQQQQSPLVVIAGSLYLVSDFLRFQRDGREEFLRYWQDSTGSVQSHE